MKKLLLLFVLCCAPFAYADDKIPPSKPAATSKYSASKPIAVDKKSYSASHPDQKAPASVKPKEDKFDKKAHKEQAVAESKQKFQQASQPATTFTDPAGKKIEIDPKDKKIKDLRTKLNSQKYENRQLRQETFYQSYYTRPVIVYHDPYSSFFWWWLLDRSVEQQALWAYHHREDMDSARYNDLMSKNAELASHVKALEQQKSPRDPSFSPEGMQDTDLMYTDDYIKAAYNPVRIESSGASVGKYVFWFLVSLLLVVLFVYIVFFKKW